MILLVPSIVYYTPDAEIRNDVETEVVAESRSGPQTYQDEMGGWWLQDEAEDFEGGEFEDTEINNGRVELALGPMPDYKWSWNEYPTYTVPNSLGGIDMVYDEANDCMICFGGGTGYDYSDKTWKFDKTTKNWNEIITSGPHGRAYHKMVYDNFNDNVILFGGFYYDGSQRPFRDTWTFNLGTSTWTQVSNTGPHARYYHSMAYDSANKKVVLYGGAYRDNNEVIDLGDTWIFDVTTNTWTQVMTSTPPERWFPVMTYDHTNQKIILYGGEKVGGGKYDDVWAFDTVTNIWTEMDSTGPTPSRDHGMSYDYINKRIIVFGNSGASTSIYDPARDLWTLRSIPGPSGGEGWKMAYDYVNNTGCCTDQMQS